MTAPRAFAAMALVAAGVWAVLVFAFGGLHFDDFLSISESHGALSLSAEQWRMPAGDGRWQPLKRVTFDALFRSAGLTFWPYAAALVIAHLGMAAGTAWLARAIWRHDEGRVAGLIALASLNLSAYSIATVGTLHGILSVALGVWAAAAAVHGRTGRLGFLVASATMTVAACLIKESAVMTPALVAYALWLSSRERAIDRRSAVRALSAPAAGVVLYFATRILLDVDLLPPRSRYQLGTPAIVLANVLAVAAGVLPWAAAAAFGWIGAIRARSRALLVDMAVMAAAAAAAVLPSLLLSWRSPNFWYAAAPVAGVGAAALLRRAPNVSRAFITLSALVIIVLAGCVGAAWRSGAYRWGPYAETSVAQWATLSHRGGRVVWFDLDSRARYGGLARTVGPGDRLTRALRLATGDSSIIATVCVSVLVAPAYVPEDGDELYVHSAGRLERVAAPPTGPWYCLP